MTSVKLHYHYMLWIIQNNIPWLDVTLTVHLPKKYTSGNLRYFQHCRTTHPIPLKVSTLNTCFKKKSEGTRSNTTNATTTKTCLVQMKSISEVLGGPSLTKTWAETEKDLQLWSINKGRTFKIQLNKSLSQN